MSEPQWHPTPHALDTTVAPPQARAPEPSNSTTNSTAQHAITAAPATAAHITAPAPTTAPTLPSNGPPASPVEEPVSLNDRLNAGDRYWKFKLAFQTIIITTGLIGIGCIGWILSTTPRFGYTPGYDSLAELWPTLITFSISIAWCAVCVLVFVLRKRPVHPGLRVAMELLLLAGFITTALFATSSLIDLLDWVPSDNLGYGSYSNEGSYDQASNGTWVWVPEDSDVSSPRICNGTGANSYDYSVYSPFADCADQDAYINKLWQDKPRYSSVELTGVICQFFGLVLHLALFVWACVDTHYYRRGKITKDAEILAAGIVQTMINNGAVVPPPGQPYMRPPMGQGVYYQLPPQQAYPMVMYPQWVPGQHQHMAPRQYRAGPPPGQVPAAGPSNEKGKGPRYA